MAKKPKNLSSEDRVLWDRVARSAKPLKRAAAHFYLAKPDTAAIPPREIVDFTPKLDLSDFDIGLTAPSEKPQNPPEKRPVRMDKKLHGRMVRGKLQPEAKIDLHGMTQAQAHPALQRFILDCHARGYRLALVITGKGNLSSGPHYDPIAPARGVLRQNVPRWLRHPSIAGYILDIREAHIRHGGAGALYVYLRK
ncbi:MAG: Smr/MutS family protein [Paracoccaceae bacterium]|jgi:DNA-nicking Smr family endonuclease